ncbi:MAG: AAA family ATPase [archaeon]|nr:AAA family ATPase [archaeon]
MIELPLRHPEIFTKLGINAPKGVLLHGPPGTGKTLLAKAVANETQAHFIAVNSPAVMCVGGNTRILTNPRGGKPIEELFLEAEKTGKIINDGKIKIVELNNTKNVFSIDKNLKIKKGKITHITRLKAKTFRIKTGLKEEIVCSENHPFACMDSFGNIVWKTAKELSKKDLIAIAKTLPEGKPKEFNYLKNFGQDAWVRTKSRVMKLEEFKGKQKEIIGVKIASKRRKIKEHEFITLPSKSSPNLLRLLGLMYSEGNLHHDGLQFANIDEILNQEYANLAKKLFGITPKIKKEKVLCYSVALKHFFEKTLDFPPIGKKGNYSLPEWIFGLTKKETAEFLAGFFEGDGTTSKGIDGYPTMRFYSITRNVLEDLSILCRKIGIIAKIVPWKTKFSDMLALVVVGNRSREIFAEKVKSDTKKFSIVKSWYETRIKKGDDLRIPNLSPLLKEIKHKKGFIYGKNLPEGPTERYISGRDYLTQRKLEEITQLMPDPSLQKLAKAEVSWTTIEEIAQEAEKELFDLSVEPYSNFLAGHSLLVMHNSKFVGEAEERIRDVFKEAEKNSPSIIFFDEIDSIAPKREEVIGEVERRVVAQILAAMDGMESRGNVIVIAATNRVNSLDEALRRPGRFDREIEIGVPSKEGRKKILQIHTRGMPLAQDVDLDHFAKITHGFVGADLEALAKEAAMKALRRYLPKINLEEETIPAEVLESLEVNKQDFLEALREVQPSALREVTIEIPNIQWSDIGGLENVKKELRQAVEWPLKRPDDFKKMGIKAPSGILLYGPPGTGKTLLAKAVATESEANFISVKGPQLISMWLGESERGIRKVFHRARQVSPTIIFFDEIDAMASMRGQDFDSGTVGNTRVVNQLLTELDGIEELKGVVYIAATNRPDLIDPALLRQGRLDKIIMIGAPDEETRLSILKVHTRKTPIEGILSKNDRSAFLKSLLKKINLPKHIEFEKLVELTEGYGKEDIEALLKEIESMNQKTAKNMPLEASEEHIQSAMKKVPPTILKELAKKTEGYSGADLQGVMREASLIAIEKNNGEAFVIYKVWAKEPDDTKKLVEQLKSLKNVVVKDVKTESIEFGIEVIKVEVLLGKKNPDAVEKTLEEIRKNPRVKDAETTTILEVSKADINEALEKIPPSISADVMNAYDQFRKNYSTIRLSYVR